MDRGRLLAETKRQLIRSGSLRLPLVLFLPAIFFTVFEPENGLNSFVGLTYIGVPLVTVPVATYRAVTDHGRIRKLHTTSPLTPAEAFLASLLALTLLWTGAILATLPLYAVALSAVPAVAMLQLSPVLLLALLLGVAGLAAGLLLANLFPHRDRLALTLSVALPLVWILPEGDLRSLMVEGSGPGAWLLETFLYTDPFSWAITADSEGPLLDDPQLLIGLAVLTAGLLVVAVLVHLGIRHRRGWERPRTGFFGAGTVLLAFLLFAGSIAQTSSYLSSSEDPHATEQPVEVEHGDISLGVHLGSKPFGTDWSKETPYELRLAVAGEPNRTVRLERLELTAEDLTFEGPTPQPPVDIQLDEVHGNTDLPGFGDRDRVGVNVTAFALVMRPEALTEPFPPTTVHMTFEGRPVTIDVSDWARWELPRFPVLVTALASAVLLEAGARVFPQRWNGW